MNNASFEHTVNEIVAGISRLVLHYAQEAQLDETQEAQLDEKNTENRGCVAALRRVREQIENLTTGFH
jgi:hypothetical protein